MYGVTTVPGRFQLVERTLNSLATAGFDEPWLFIDGCPYSEVPTWMSRYRYACRFPRIRTAANWILSAAELYLREPTADRYAVFQDDLITYRNLRQFLEKTKYPERGYLNLYTFPQNVRPQKGWYLTKQNGFGAVALVFDNEALRTLLSQAHLYRRARDPKRGWKAIDGGIVTAMNQAGWKEYVHNPSLVQHTGMVSSMGNGRHPLTPVFLGEETDALSLI